METKIEQQEVSDDTKEAELKSPSSKSRLVWVAIFILLCLHGGLYWLWYQQQSVNSQLAEDIASSTPKPVDTTKFEQSLAIQGQQLQDQLAGVKSEQTALQDAIEVMKSSQQLSKGDVEYHWAIAEVTYLLNVANQQLLLASNVQGAKEALSFAGSRVESLNDYRLHPLKALITDELLALSAVNKVDVDGLSLQLESALKGINQLQVVMAEPLIDEDDSPLAGESWQGALDQAWQEVKSLVVIRHQQDGAAAVLVPEQRYFLYQNLQLKLESAQLALLNGNSLVYEQNLASAQQWLEQYFTGNNRDAMLELLATLKSQNVETTLPDISGSLTWLRGFEQ
jgi:uroporphyrin-3 C-methyltransferase